MNLASSVMRGGLRSYRSLVNSRPIHSALKRQLKADKKQKEKEAKEAQQPATVSEHFNFIYIQVQSTRYGVLPTLYDFSTDNFKEAGYRRADRS